MIQMPVKVKPAESSTRELSLERIVFFSDAVMAIALTLLAVDLRLPEIPGITTSQQLLHALLELLPRILSFLISFMVVAIYWSSHHRYFNFIERYDSRLIWLNMVFLLSIVSMPFIADLMGKYYDLPAVEMIYAAAVAFTGYAMSAIWWYASHHHRLVKASLEESFIRQRRILLLVGPTMFLFSIPLALISFTSMIIAWWLSPFVSLFILRWMEGGWKSDRKHRLRKSSRLNKTPPG